MNIDAEDPLLAAAARICDGVPVDWRNVRQLLANPALETIASELEWIEHFARVSGAPSAWGRFSIVRELGRGVFGTVYRAVDSSLQIEVALKIIRPRPGVPFDYERAMQEARRLARVRHPAVVRVFGVERIGGEVGVNLGANDQRRRRRHASAGNGRNQHRPKAENPSHCFPNGIPDFIAFAARVG